LYLVESGQRPEAAAVWHPERGPIVSWTLAPDLGTFVALA
jgi:hypothetical protein